MANKITLSIAGFNLIINTTEEEEQVRKLNDILNQDLTNILSNNPSASVTNAALLCALDYLDRYDKATHSANNLRAQIKDYLADASNAKLMYDDEVKKNSDLTKEIQSLRAHVTKLATEGANGTAMEESLRKELDAAKSDAEILRRQLKDQLDQNRQLSDSVDQLTDHSAQQEQEIRRLEELNNSQRETIEELNQRPVPTHTDEEYAALSAKVEQYESRISSFASQVKDLEALNTSLQEDYDSLASEYDVLADAQTKQPEVAPAPTAEDLTDYSFSSGIKTEEPQSISDEALLSEVTSAEQVDEEPVFEDITSPTLLDDDSFTYEEEEAKPVEEHFSNVYDFSTDSYEPAPENENLGVGDGFKTFGQMIAEEMEKNKPIEQPTLPIDDLQEDAPFNFDLNHSFSTDESDEEPDDYSIDTPSVEDITASHSFDEDDDDDLPNLSWINDI